MELENLKKLRNLNVQIDHDLNPEEMRIRNDLYSLFVEEYTELHGEHATIPKVRFSKL